MEHVLPAQPHMEAQHLAAQTSDTRAIEAAPVNTELSTQTTQWDITTSVAWNLCLITLGALFLTVGINGIALPYGFLTGGLTGVGLLLHYVVNSVDVSTWFFLLNVPLFVLGLFFVSRRFVLYSFYGMLIVTLCLRYVHPELHIEDKVMAALACGVLMGVGTGMALRSLGSHGGADILAILLHKTFNLGMGQFMFFFNAALFGVGLFFLDLNTLLYSTAMIFVSSMAMEYVLGLFNKRKMVYIISEAPSEIAQAITNKLHRGCTFLHGQGAYTGNDRKIVMTIVNTIQMRQLEDLIFGLDPKAFTITSNTLSVLGEGFSKRRMY